MEMIIVAVFILGYLAITIEHTLKIDKLIPALLMMALAWALIAFGLDGFTNWFDSHDSKLMNEGYTALNHEGRMHLMEGTLLHHFGKTCEILIFLVGAMTIVEIIDSFNGFATFKNFIKTNKKRTLLWIVCILGFILSAIIDNLTATIVLITILRKLLPENKDRIWYAGMIIIAANAGGAWSPIGDVTTTMLWMQNKVTAMKLMEFLILPSILCMALPTFIASLMPAFKGSFISEVDKTAENKNGPFMLYLGLVMIVFVPIFKTITHLPPYVGMMLSLAIVSLVAEIVSNRKFSMTSKVGEDFSGDHSHGAHSSPTFKALSKIEMPSILFFLGTPVIALSIGFILSLFLLTPSTAQKAKKENWIGQALSGTSDILLITGAGGIFGKVLQESGLGDSIGQIMENWPLGIWLPFLLATTIKTAQGSSTIAMITTASIVAPLMPSLGLHSDTATALTVVAIGAGSVMISHVNDSYFWVVTKLTGLSVAEGYKTHSLGSIVLGLSAMLLCVFFLAIFSSTIH